MGMRARRVTTPGAFDPGVKQHNPHRTGRNGPTPDIAYAPGYVGRGGAVYACVGLAAAQAGPLVVVTHPPLEANVLAQCQEIQERKHGQ